MTKREMATYRETLLRLADRLGEDVAQLSDEALRQTGGEASGSLSNAPIHMADLGSDNFEDELTLGFLENEGQLHHEIAAALARIDAGTFGQCEQCGRHIPKPRLAAVPWARHCIDCARAAEARRD